MSKPVDMIIRKEASNLEFLEALKPHLDYLKSQYGAEIKYEVGMAPVDIVLFTDDKPRYYERKKTADFAASIIDKRLWEQADSMKKEASKGVFIIEGSFSGIDEWHPDSRNSIIGAERKLIKDGIHIIYGYDKDWTSTYIKFELEELNNITHKRRITLRPAAGKTLGLPKQAQYVLEGFPGIGGAKSEIIRQNSSSLWGFLETINYKTNGIKFLPPKLVENIKSICMTNWKIENNGNKS